MNTTDPHRPRGAHRTTPDRATSESALKDLSTEGGRRRAIGVVAALQPALGWRASQAEIAKRGRL